MTLNNYNKIICLVSTILVFPISLYAWFSLEEIPFNEIRLTVISLAFEIGLPVVLGIVSFVSLAYRRYGLVMLGAISPFLPLYSWLVFGYVLDPAENEWAFGAAWVMSFLPFVAMLWLGAVICFFVPSKIRPISAFGTGLAASISSVLAFIIFEHVAG